MDLSVNQVWPDKLDHCAHWVYACGEHLELLQIQLFTTVKYLDECFNDARLVLRQ